MARMVEIDYTNWRGERSVRRVEPTGFYYGQTEFHPNPQWLLIARDVIKGRRVFAMKDIHRWTDLTANVLEKNHSKPTTP